MKKIKMNTTKLFGLLVLLMALAIGSCVTDRDTRTMIYNENVYLDKNFLTSGNFDFPPGTGGIGVDVAAVMGRKNRRPELIFARHAFLEVKHRSNQGQGVMPHPSHVERFALAGCPELADRIQIVTEIAANTGQLYVTEDRPSRCGR